MTPRLFSALCILVGVAILLVLSVAWWFALGFFVFMNALTRPRDPSQTAFAIVVWFVVQGVVDFASVKAAASLSGGRGVVTKIMVAICAVFTLAVFVWSIRM